MPERDPISPPRTPTAMRGDAAELFAGPGELRARCREVDWGATPLGDVAAWPQSLRTAAQLVTAAGLPNILLWGPALTQIYNDAYAAIIGAKHPRALGRGNEEVWPEVWHINGPIFERVFAGETVNVADSLYPLARTGAQGVLEDVYLTISFSPVRDERGAVAGVLANMIETTSLVQRRALEAERERLLHALQLEESRLTAVFERAPTYLAMLRGPDFVFARVNEAYQQLVGHREVVGRPVAEVVPEAAEQGFVGLLERVVATGEPYVGREVPILLRRRPGAPPEQRFLDFIYQPLVEVGPDGESRRAGVVAHGSDVTEQVLTRRAVERASRRAERLQALTAALAATTTPEEAAEVVVARGVAHTGAATGMLAVRAGADEVVVVRQAGVPDEILTAGSRLPLDHPGPAARCIRTGEGWFVSGQEALREHFPAMAEVWERLGARALATVPLRVGGETVGAMSFTFTAPHPFDDDERALFEAFAGQCAQALERARLFAAEHVARTEAEHANRAKADFLAAMSHELRTPLNAIAGYAELMAMGIRGPVTAEQREDLARIRRNQQYLLGIINDILNFAKLEAGHVRFDIGDVPLGPLLDDVATMVLPQIRARGLDYEVRLRRAGLVVRADREKLLQVLLNLLSNAVKFTAPPGEVALCCEPDDGVVRIRVRDTGIGIPADRLPQIFDPFVQIDRRHVSAHEGTGLGLAISRDLARGMGGELTAESAQGEGSTFTLVLPAGAPEPAAGA
jgi:signal transduction histidine kinase